MIGNMDKVKWAILLAPGAAMGAFLAYWLFTNFGLIAFLLDVLATCGALALIGKMASGVYWSFKGPRPLYEREDKPLRALVDHDGRVQVMPLPAYPAGLQTLNYHNAPHITAKEQPALPAPVVDALPALPTAKSIYELAPAMHNVDKVLLGYDEQGPIWLEIDDLLSIAMAGNSGRGKSRALLWLVVQFLRLKVATVIIDGKADLRKWLGIYHPVAYTPPEIQRVVDEGIYDIEQRLEADSQGLGMEFPPKLFIIDELDLVAGRYAGVTKLIELLTKKSRSVNVHGVYSNQSIPADLVGGIKNRGVIVSRICFYCDDEAAQLIGVRERNGGSELLQRIGPPAPQGLALARTAVFGWKLVAFPFVPDTAISFMLEGLNPLRPLPMKVQPTDPYAAQYGYPFGLPSDEKTVITGSLSLSPPPAAPKTAPTAPKPPLSEREKEREKILELAAQGFKPYVIARKLGRAGAYAEEVKEIIAEAGNIASKEG